MVDALPLWFALTFGGAAALAVLVIELRASTPDSAPPSPTVTTESDRPGR